MKSLFIILFFPIFASGAGPSCDYFNNKINEKVEVRRDDAEREKKKNDMIIANEDGILLETAIRIESARNCSVDSGRVENHFEGLCSFNATRSSCEEINPAIQQAKSAIELSPASSPPTPPGDKAPCDTMSTTAKTIAEYRNKAYKRLQNLKKAAQRLKQVGQTCGQAVDGNLNSGQCRSAMTTAEINDFISRDQTKTGCYPQQVEQTKEIVEQVMNSKKQIVCQITNKFNQSKDIARKLASKMKEIAAKIQETDGNLRSIASSYKQACQKSK